MISLPVYNKQVDDSCIVRVSVESINTGNVYKSILVGHRALSGREREFFRLLGGLRFGDVHYVIVHLRPMSV